MASMAHRVAKGLVGGCALLLGVMVTGCAAPQYTYVANSDANTYFKVPHSWHAIGPGALAAVLKAEAGGGEQPDTAHDVHGPTLAPGHPAVLQATRPRARRIRPTVSTRARRERNLIPAATGLVPVDPHPRETCTIADEGVIIGTT